MAEYLRYVIRNIEPIRIADESTSQSGQTNTLRYIPGTTIRGLVIHALAANACFTQWKERLFDKEMVYLNAFLMANGKELLPSPKGFYEDKSVVEGKKKIQNVVLAGEFEEGYKRASLGRYSYFEEDCIRYYNVDTGSDMKIKINTELDEERNMFRNEYIMPGHLFCGYIKIGFPEVREALEDIFKGCIVLGNARSAGLGKCEVVSCEFVKQLPYEEYLPQKEQTGHCYMMLLSNTAMRKSNGELCGMDCEQLKEKMGVQDLEIKFCSTSTVTVRGYNRTWQSRTPSVVMFEQGSVFKLTYTGTFTRERMEALCNEGIGIHRNEGCGRILFLKDYEKLCFKKAGEEAKTQCNETAKQHKEDEEVLYQVAKRLYVRRLEQAMEQYIVSGQFFKKGSISRSQLGSLEALISINRYEPEEAEKQLLKYLEKFKEKEENRKKQKDLTSVKKVYDFIKNLKEQPLEEILIDYMPNNTTKIMGMDKATLLSKEEELSWKLQLITNLIRYDNKKESR